MKLFGWKPGRVEARPALSRGGSTTGDWPPSYEAQVREGYCRNAVAQRAVRLVAEAVASAPVTASDPGLGALVGCRAGGVPVLETVAAQLQLHGNAFVQVLRDADGAAVALYPLRPERVSVEADATGWPAAYRYQVGARATRLHADAVKPEVVHLKAFHPLDDHYGLGALGAAAAAIAVHNASATWNKALLDNAARPSGALVYDPGDGSTLSPEQFQRLSSEMEQGFSGAAQAGRPMLLEGGLKWQALSLTPADMDFVELKAAAAREIALAFGVPPMLLGLPGDSTHANYREANRALWRLAVLPLAASVLDGLARGLSGWWPDAALAIDLNKVPALGDADRLRAAAGGAGGAAGVRGVGEVRFTGYAALFDRVDRAGDVFRAGAFADAAVVPLLWQHRGNPVGALTAVREDARGLLVEGFVTEPAVARLVRSGALPGLSVGFRAVRARQSAWRELLAVALIEVSLVAVPMQPLARIEVLD